jgi:hypothetical protein
MRRAAPRIGEKFGVGPRRPQPPLRLARAEGVEDLEAEAERAGERGGFFEQVGGFGIEIAGGARIDGPPGEVGRRRIGDVEEHVMARRADIDEAGMGLHDRRVSSVGGSS